MHGHEYTQTYEMKTRSATTVRDGATQMARPDLLLDDSRDRPMAPGRYLTSDEHHLLRLKKTIVIQRYARGWFARRRARQVRLRELWSSLAPGRTMNRIMVGSGLTGLTLNLKVSPDPCILSVTCLTLWAWERWANVGWDTRPTAARDAGRAAAVRGGGGGATTGRGGAEAALRDRAAHAAAHHGGL